MSEFNHDWAAASTLYTNDMDKMADAFYFLGSENVQSSSQEAKYSAILKLASWDQIQSSNLVSYPKRYILFVFLIIFH